MLLRKSGVENRVILGPPFLGSWTGTMPYLETSVS